MLKTGIDGSWGRSIFNFLRNHHIVFYCDYTNLHSHQDGRSVLFCFVFSPHPCQHGMPFALYVLDILTCMRWTLRMVLICISLMTKYVEHLSASHPFWIPVLSVLLIFISYSNWWFLVCSLLDTL